MSVKTFQRNVSKGLPNQKTSNRIMVVRAKALAFRPQRALWLALQNWKNYILEVSNKGYDTTWHAKSVQGYTYSKQRIIKCGRCNQGLLGFR